MSQLKHLKITTEDNQVEEQTTVLLDGPLSNVYARALNIAYAKTEESPEGGEAIVPANESQAIDVSVAEKLKQNEIEELEHSDQVIEIPYSYNPSTSEQSDTVEVIKAVNSLSKNNIDFIFYEDLTGPEVQNGSSSQPYTGKSLAIESVQIVVKLKKI